MINSLKSILLILLFNISLSAFYDSKNTSEVLVYCGTNKDVYDQLKTIGESFGVSFKKIENLNKTDKRLHIIFDAYNIPFQYFPENYLLYQTLDLDKVPLTKSYFEKLSNAITVWDPNWKNIAKYSLLIDNYYYFSMDRIDPLILPCLIPNAALGTYKKLVTYSNEKDTDISSHLPALFIHTLLKNPNLLMEIGIRNGESTRAFEAALRSTDSKLIGVDICAAPAQVYKNITIANSEFYHLDDIAFASWWNASSPYKSVRPDIIFIDTSHHYAHTVQELESFVPMLNQDGLLIFHDTNMCPLANGAYQRLNGTSAASWDNKKGVIRAIKEFFSISFDESQYIQLNFTAKGFNWSLLHYPYCNGCTLIKRLG